MINNVVLIGNLGADPEVFYNSEGTPYGSFSLAFRSSRKMTGWIKVMCFNKLAELSEKYLHKGGKIVVSGTLDQNKWEGDDGKTRTSFQIIANNIEFVKTDGRGFDENKNPEEEPF